MRIENTFEGEVFSRVEMLINGEQQNVQLVGPLSYENTAHVARLLEAEAFYRREYSQSAPYLLDARHEEWEKEYRIKERSFYFFAIHNDQIMASVRLTPFPFETTILPISPEMQTAKLHDYLEFSRLMSVADLPLRPIAVSKLLLKAGLWAFRETSFEGLFGLCKRPRANFFSKFGLHSKDQQQYTIDCRNQEPYVIVSGAREEIIRNILNQVNQIEEFEIKARPNSCTQKAEL